MFFLPKINSNKEYNNFVVLHRKVWRRGRATSGKSEMAWKWIVRRTRESKPFFLAFATICGVVPGVIGYGVMQLT